MRKSLWVSATVSAMLVLLAGCKTGKPTVTDQPGGIPISQIPTPEQPRVDAPQPSATQAVPSQPASPSVEPPQHAAAPGPAPQQPVIPQPTPQPAVTQQPPPLINPVGAQPGAPAELPANATVDQVLDALDQRGKTMREFTAKVSLTDGEPLHGDESTRSGQIWFQKKGEEDGRLHVVFDKRIEGKASRAEKTEDLLDDRWLIDRNYRKSTQTSREVLKPGEKMNLLKLGEGPFPLPLGQKKEDVHKLFEVTEVPPTADEAEDKDLADTIHLALVPKPGTRFSRRYGEIDVWVDRKSNFPVQIHTAAPDESDPHTTKLKNVQVNPADGLKDGDFALPKIDEQAWSLHTDHYRE